jgi:hypothetical protein
MGKNKIATQGYCAVSEMSNSTLMYWYRYHIDLYFKHQSGKVLKRLQELETEVLRRGI